MPKTAKKAKSKTKSGSKKSKFVEKKVGSKTLVISVSFILVAALIISAVIVFGGRSRSPVLNYEFEETVSSGVDISEHNGSVDWQVVKDNIDFAFIRVGYRGYESGEILADECYEENLSGCQKAGIPYGVYFYSQATTEAEAEEEAEFLIKAVKNYRPTLPLVIDFEYASNRWGMHTGRLYNAKMNSNEKAAVINAFCKKVEKAGYASGLYASASVLANEINTNKLGKNTLIWLAEYNSEVTYDVEYTVWQYTEKGTLEGVSSEFVDLNYWFK